MFAACSSRPSQHRRRAFTLVELVMVVTIIGMVAAIAVPRISSAATNARLNALSATVVEVQKAIDTYYAEHSKYPGYNPVGGAPDGNAFVLQLTKYSSDAGRSNSTYGAPYFFGPYLRAPFPANPFNNLRTVHVKANHASPSPSDGSVGWVAVLSDGSFGLSATDVQFEEVGVFTIEGKTKLRAGI